VSHRLLRLALFLPAAPLAVSGAAAQETPPRLTVVVVVDQMRADLLERFDDQLTRGFRRLLDQGAVYTRAAHRHGVPHTGPGHATLATGTYPSHHGIVANNWLDRSAWRAVYAVDDSLSGIPGDPSAPGRSPANLMRPALGAAVRKAYPGARVVAVAGKDRAAATMAGHQSDAAYWFDSERGRFVTSSYWADRLPPWLEELNRSGVVDSLAAEPWVLSRSESAYDRSRQEPLWPDEGPGFPHPSAVEADADYAAATGSAPDGFPPQFTTRPFLDELTFAVARAAVEHHRLGEDEIPDVLWVGASASDYIGHAYGPFSREVQDHYLRLDAMLGQFLDWLDARVAGGYVVALSSDHGVLAMPEELLRHGYDAGRVPADSLAAHLRQAVDDAATAEEVASPIPAGLIVLDAYLALPPNMPDSTRRGIRRRTAESLRKIDGVADVVTVDEVRDTGAGEPGGSANARPLVEAYRRSWFPGRSPDLWIRPRDGWLAGVGDRITAHLAPYDYDLRVPLVLAGPGIVPGRYGRPVATVDLVPTLAALLGIDPGDVDGAPLLEALGNDR
jgi:predicted AlkP superfamily pyrophosphatase or phosphodiesterase